MVRSLDGPSSLPRARLHLNVMALRAMREASLSRSPGYLNKEIFLFSLREFMIGYAHGAGWEADDRQGNWASPSDGAGLFP